MEIVLDDKLIDFVLNNFDRLTALRILLALSRAKRLYNTYKELQTQWNSSLTCYLQKLLQALEEKNSEKVNELKKLVYFCEELKMSEDYVIKLIKQAKRCENPETRALIVAKIIDYFAPKELNTYATYINKLSQIINEMKSSLEENDSKKG